MKKKLYSMIFIIILLIIIMASYSHYYNSLAAYTSRVNTMVTYWEQLVPDANINTIIKKYGKPLAEEIKKNNRNPNKPDEFDTIHQLKYKDIDITTTNGADGYNMVTAVSIKTAGIKIKYGLHIGVKINKVLKELGQPFNEQKIGNKTIFTYIPVYKENQYGHMLGYVEFILTDNNVTAINWLTVIDD